MNEKKILIVDKKSIKELFKEEFFLYQLDEINIYKILKKAKFCFFPRFKAEEDTTKKQIIPYIIIKDNRGRFLIYNRKGNEKRLHGFYSLGVGGHIDIEDIEQIQDLKDKIKTVDNCFNLDLKTFNKIMTRTIEREIYEETGIKFENEKTNKLELLGFINEDISAVGKVHLGLVCLYSLNTDSDNIKPIDNEIDYFDFLDIDQIYKIFNSLEKWSILALSLLNVNKKLIFISNKKLGKKEKSMFFENYGITEFIEYITKKEDIENFKDFLKFILSGNKENTIYYKLKNQDLIKIKQECEKNRLIEIK